jgi:Family of unknown function (DUF6152)
MRIRLFGLLILTASVFTTPILAHHGTEAAYDTTKRITLKGTVTQFLWANPHCGILFDVTDDKGSVTHWGAEETNPHALSLVGWTKDVLKPGDKITITGAPSKFGAPRMQSDHVVLADGRVLNGILSRQAPNAFPGLPGDTSPARK